MDKIDTNSEQYLDVAKESIGLPEAQLIREIVSKLNEIVEWINKQ